MRRLALCLLAALSLLVLPAAANAFTLYTPASGSAHGTSLPIDVQFGSGASNKRVIFQAAGGATWTLDIGDGGSRSTFTTSSSDLVGGSGGVVTGVSTGGGASGTSLPEGTYSVYARYFSVYDFLTETSNTSTGVVIDRTSQQPTLTSPANASAATGSFTVSYTLAEAASVARIRFAATDLTTREVTLASANRTAGSHTVTIDPTQLGDGLHVASVSGGSNLPDADWTISVAAQDNLSNPSSTSNVRTLTLDTATWLPALLAPASLRTYTDPTLSVEFGLPEAALAGSVTLQLQASGVDRTLTFDATSSGTHTVLLNRMNLAASAGVASVAGGSDLPDGTYTATLGYQDVSGNARVDVFNDEITLAPPPPPPVDPTPAADPTPPVAGPPAAMPPLTLAPSVPAALGARFSSSRRARGQRLLRAEFKVPAGAVRYRLTATRGGTTRSGRCQVRRGQVSCSVTVAGGKPWALSVTAFNAAGAVIASATQPARR